MEHSLAFITSFEVEALILRFKEKKKKTSRKHFLKNTEAVGETEKLKQKNLV
jgi:hypothetical protein